MQVLLRQKPTYKDTLLAKDKNLARWYNNLKQGSIITAEVGLRRVGKVCKMFDTTPAKMAKMNVKQATNLCMDLVTEMTNQGKQPKYVSHSVKVLKSWFAFNGIKIDQRIKVSDTAKVPSKVDKEQSPMPQELGRVLDHADVKQKPECVLIAFAGTRIESIGDYVGSDGLRVGDLPEMVADNTLKTVSFAKTPTLVVVRRNLSKAGHQYFTFMPEQGCDYLKDFLEHRMRLGETLTADSPIVTTLRFHNRSRDANSFKHITSRKIGQSIKTAIEKAGNDWRPYILRTYFDTRLMMAEADGLLIKDWRKFFMGHKGDIEAVYTVNKGKLPSDTLEMMRDAFAKASDKHLVTTRKRDATIDMVKAQFNRQFLEIAGMSAEQIDALGDLGKMTAEDMNNLLKENSKKSLGLNGNSQKVVAIADVEKYIGEGWEFVTPLPEGKVVIKLPNARN